MILGETQSAIRDVVRDFVHERVKANSFAFEAAKAYPRELFEEMAAIGLMGMTASPEAIARAVRN